MSLTLTGRVATSADADFAVAMAAEAGNSRWSADTVATYLSLQQTVIGVIIANWPENNIVNRPVAMVHGIADGTTFIIQHMALDPAVIAKTAGNAGARLKAADTVLRFILTRAQNNGMVRGAGQHIPIGSPMQLYVETLTGATVDFDDGTYRSYSMPIADLLAFLNSAARQAQYGGA